MYGGIHVRHALNGRTRIRHGMNGRNPVRSDVNGQIRTRHVIYGSEPCQARYEWSSTDPAWNKRVGTLSGTLWKGEYGPGKKWIVETLSGTLWMVEYGSGIIWRVGSRGRIFQMDCLVELLYLSRLLEGAEEGDRLLSTRRHPVLNVSKVMYCGGSTFVCSCT